MVKIIKPRKSVTVERIQKVLQHLDELVLKAIQDGNMALLKVYKKRLLFLLGLSESLRLQFVYGAAYMLPYTIGDEVNSCDQAIKALEKQH
jgi:hypothetical protein